MAKIGAAIEAAIARISKKQVQPAIRELRSAIRRMENALRKQGRASGARLGGRGSRGTKVDAGPTMSPAEVKALRARLGMTQAEFARATGVTHVAVYVWESGRTKPAGQRLLRLRELEGEASGRKPARKPAGKKTSGGARKKRAAKRRAKA
jgi:hypothetical protein